jgi:hypothetical protein
MWDNIKIGLGKYGINVSSGFSWNRIGDIL